MPYGLVSLLRAKSDLARFCSFSFWRKLFDSSIPSSRVPFDKQKQKTTHSLHTLRESNAHQQHQSGKKKCGYVHYIEKDERLVWKHPYLIVLEASFELPSVVEGLSLSLSLSNDLSQLVCFMIVLVPTIRTYSRFRSHPSCPFLHL